MNTEIETLKSQIRDWKIAQWNASQRNYARGVMKANRELDRLYALLRKAEGR